MQASPSSWRPENLVSVPGLDSTSTSEREVAGAEQKTHVPVQDEKRS